MVNSITLHMNMGSAQPWDNPNLWPGDINGNPVTPQNGVPCYLWARVQNNGTVTAQDVTVAFYVLLPATSLTWPTAPHGTNSIPSLAVGANQNIKCSVQWIPDSSSSSHQCLAAAASCLDCPPPPTTPGTPVDSNNQQVAQHNVTISTVSATAKTASRTFNVFNAQNAGHLEVRRVPLAQNPEVLKSRGIDPNMPEAPENDSLSILNAANGRNMGSSVNFSAGESLALEMVASFKEHKPGTGALYHVCQYENGKLVGGVSHIALL